jgi:hypothetical protein
MIESKNYIYLQNYFNCSTLVLIVFGRVYNNFCALFHDQGFPFHAEQSVECQTKVVEHIKLQWHNLVIQLTWCLAFEDSCNRLTNDE